MRWLARVGLGLVAVIVATGLIVLSSLTPASLVTIRGWSMQPTLHYGDRVVLWRSSSYEKGDIVAFAGHAGPELHRIIRQNADGTFTTQGDNAKADDANRLRPDQIAGRLVFGPITPLQLLIAAGGLITLAAVCLWFIYRRPRAVSTNAPARAPASS